MAMRPKTIAAQRMLVNRDNTVGEGTKEQMAQLVEAEQGGGIEAEFYTCKNVRWKLKKRS